MKSPLLPLLSLPLAAALALTVFVPHGSAAPRHRPANPRGVADPRGVFDPRGPFDPRNPHRYM